MRSRKRRQMAITNRQQIALHLKNVEGEIVNSQWTIFNQASNKWRMNCQFHSCQCCLQMKIHTYVCMYLHEYTFMWVVYTLQECVFSYSKMFSFDLRTTLYGYDQVFPDSIEKVSRSSCLILSRNAWLTSPKYRKCD